MEKTSSTNTSQRVLMPVQSSPNKWGENKGKTVEVCWGNLEGRGCEQCCGCVQSDRQDHGM